MISAGAQAGMMGGTVNSTPDDRKECRHDRIL